MFSIDIPKTHILKVLSACWREHNVVDCLACERERYSYDDDSYDESHTNSCEGWEDCAYCQACYQADKERRLATYQTPSSPECVRVMEEPLHGEDPIVRYGDDNPYGGAGWVVSMQYAVGMTCRYCEERMPYYCASYFISDDGSIVTCWAD